MATLPQPVTNTALLNQLGLPAILSAQISMQLMEKLDVLPLVALRGDAARSGSNVIRVRYAGGIGWAAPLQAMASDTDAPPEASPVAGYTSVTIAPFGLQMTQSFLSSVIADPAAAQAMSLEAFARMAGESWLAMARAQTCVVGAAFATAIGSSATTLSVDNVLALIAAIESQAGAVDVPMAPVMLAPTQLTQLRASVRSEPAFQNSAGDLNAPQAATRRLSLAGLDFIATNDVTTSGGAYQGFAFHRGGIGYGTASTTPENLPIPSGADPLYVPDFGLVTFRQLNQNGQQVLGQSTMAYVGFAAGDSTVYFQRRLISAV